MTDLVGIQPPSRIELVVLARLSTGEPKNEMEIAEVLKQVGVALEGRAMADLVAATTVALRNRALVMAARVSNRVKKPRYTATESGRAALRDVLELKATPTWKTMCERIIPALALGVPPAGEAAAGVLSSAEAMTATLLRRDRALGEPATIQELCDSLIARALGMPPGSVTYAGICAYALATHCGVDSKGEFEQIATRFPPPKKRQPKKHAKAKHTRRRGQAGKLQELAAKFAGQQLNHDVKKKPALAKALRQHWVSQRDDADAAAPWSAPLQPVQNTGDGDRPVRSAPRLDTDPLLAAVREAIPRIGSDGRYGKENVFVSALWRKLADDWRTPDLSLESFKRWLVAANRNQLLALARADLIDDMDARLVEDSEIEDLGTTFHFVLDGWGSPRASTQVHRAR